MILILAEENDVSATLVESRLRERGHQVVRFNASRFPAHAELSISYTPHGRSGAVLRDGDTVIDLEKISAVWFRAAPPSIPHDVILDEPSREALAEESRVALLDAWHAVGCRWLPGPIQAVRDGQLKLRQLSLAGEIGFELPPTLLTTNPDDLLAFYTAHDGHIISKLADLGFHKTLGREFARYTEVVTRRDIMYADAVRYCPMIYQAYVPKRLELRVTVVGAQVFAAEIRSQASNRTRHDWRRYDDGATTYAPHDLPDDIRHACLALTWRLGLCYGAIDLILTPDGRYVFLEINPAGQFGWIEQATGLPISNAICDVLAGGPLPFGITQLSSPEHVGGDL